MAPQGAHICFFGSGARYNMLLGQKWTKIAMTYFAPAGSLRRKSLIFPDVWKVQTLISLVFDSETMMFL